MSAALEISLFLVGSRFALITIIIVVAVTTRDKDRRKTALSVLQMLVQGQTGRTLHDRRLPRNRRDNCELELDRVTGPTMLEDLLHRPWRLCRHARLLADLQHRLHRIPAPAWLRPGPAHAARGPGAADTALTWTTLACFDHDASGLKAWLADTFRCHYLDCFLDAAGREPARALLQAIVEYRIAHPQRARNIRAGEREALRRLAATAAGPP